MGKPNSYVQHYAILVNNQSAVGPMVKDLIAGRPICGLEHFIGKKSALFSRSEIHRFMDEEERHDLKVLTAETEQALKTMSSGEQKKALLRYLLKQTPDFLVLVNPFDNLDKATQKELKAKLEEVSTSISLIQIVSRLVDILPITTHFARLQGNELLHYANAERFRKENSQNRHHFSATIPRPLHKVDAALETLVKFNDVSVSFGEKQVLRHINWTIEKGEFWQLIGPNGSGKTTLLTMITGDSHKGYGQDLTVFDHKKGTGESVWDLKKHIGYFTPAMIDRFRGYHTLENMLISGLHDSVGLYVRPSDAEKRLARQWLSLLHLETKGQTYFHDLGTGEKRLVMTARAMIKHPLLLILDEPTAGLDDANANLFVSLVDKIASESDSAILFVSHRTEPGLHPEKVLELTMTNTGSKGKLIIIDQ
ncbi:ATP-binding cassette domain-containing protein [Allomuricauda sp. SCSIO 65647]|uniref:ATP-binding cassette domain-containing protein n=1 Tax=Allomuricauda sp. SCSIO 65647 TaxID=2908843 RepID=UPI001F3784B7|nr:ATP-binding cassette domain-containing protein [Muricauda sp. SCSIO 65647]UJH66700.1 ATP-binding cassette domain-containing protein [Muricauda sp. SCSIO 65647]